MLLRSSIMHIESKGDNVSGLWSDSSRKYAFQDTNKIDGLMIYVTNCENNLGTAWESN